MNVHPRIPMAALRSAAVLIAIASLATGASAQLRLSGEATVEIQAFLNAPSYPEQNFHALSFRLHPRLEGVWAGGTLRLEVEPYLRYDGADPMRTSADLRTLTFEVGRGHVRLGAGLRLADWGVSHSRDLVDVVNQTDRAEHPMADEKLGQPMGVLGAPLLGGELEILALTGFRERTFPGPESRLRGPGVVDAPSLYAPGAARSVEWATRWTLALGRGHVGLSAFNGRDRSPRMKAEEGVSGLHLTPVYDAMWQVGSEAELPFGGWTATAEAIVRDEHSGDRFAALSVGVERRLAMGVAGGSELTVVVEYVRDSRGVRATSGMEDDFFASLKLRDTAGRPFKLFTGVIVDRGSGAGALTVDLEQELDRGWRLVTGGWGFWGADLGQLTRDSYVSVGLKRRF